MSASWDQRDPVLDHPRKWSAYTPDAPAITFADLTRLRERQDLPLVPVTAGSPPPLPGRSTPAYASPSGGPPFTHSISGEPHPSDQETLTWRDLDQRTEAVAAFLVDLRGLRPGDRVALLARNSADFLIVLYACLRTGLILAPLNWRLSPREQAAILDLAEPALLLHDSNMGTEIPWPGPRYAMEGLPRTGVRRDRRAPGTGLEDPALLLFTSGTTGLPKAAMLPGRQLFWNVVNTGLAFELTRRDSTLVYTPLFHTGAINVLALPLLHCGGHVVIHEAFDAGAILRDVIAFGITTLFGVPTTLQMLLEHPSGADLPSLRLLLCGGAPLPVSLIQAWQARGHTLTQGFGMTEVGPNCFFLPPHEALRRAGSVGRPMPFCEARVVGPDGLDAPAGQVGELWLAGPHVCLGYFRNAEATAKAIDAEGWFHTGDLARIDEGGFFHIAGRKKEMFISGGENVYPAEVELALAAHPAVAECAVVSMPDSRWGEVGCAFVVPRNDDLEVELLRPFLRAALAGYKVPKAFVPLSALPRNPSGKVLKDRLQEEARRHAG